MSFFEDDDNTANSQEQESFFTQPRAGPSNLSKGTAVVSRTKAARASTAELDSGYNEASLYRDQLSTDADFDFDQELGLGETDAGQDNPVVRLARRWMDERSAPELLQSDPNGDMDLCLQTLLRQVGLFWLCLFWLSLTPSMISKKQ